MKDWRDNLTGWQIFWFIVLLIVPLPIGPSYVTVPAIIVLLTGTIVFARGNRKSE